MTDRVRAWLVFVGLVLLAFGMTHLTVAAITVAT
jgi:hypothetical protein